MKTLFVNAPFSRYEVGWNGPALGQIEIPFLGDLLALIGVDEQEIQDLIQQIPTENLSEYKARFEECKAKAKDVPLKEAALKAGPCFYQLYMDLKNAVKGGPSGPPQPVQPPPPPPSEFPWVPVGIGVLATGALVYFLATA